jgi:hypothetical protein
MVEEMMIIIIEDKIEDKEEDKIEMINIDI